MKRKPPPGFEGLKERLDAAVSNPHRCDCEKAVREEREAILRYLRTEEAWTIAVFGIERGEHRK